MNRLDVSKITKCEVTAQCKGPDGARTAVALVLVLTLTDMQGEEPLVYSHQKSLNEAELKTWNVGGETRSDLISALTLEALQVYEKEYNPTRNEPGPEEIVETESVRTIAVDAISGYPEKLAARREELQIIIDAGKAAEIELAKLPTGL